MILDEKPLMAPPPYSRRVTPKPTLSKLPPHLLLQIVYFTFPMSDGKFSGEGKNERQRQTLHWLHTSLRFVNRALYVACMHILRSTYLPAYEQLVRPPYTSDPFFCHREMLTLDLFLAVLAHEDVMIDSTSLHLPREEAYKDLFDLVQPRSRLEDLVAQQGRKYGVLSLGEVSPPPTPTPSIAKPDTSSPYVFSPPPSSSSLPATSSPVQKLAPSTSKSLFKTLKTTFKKPSKAPEPSTLTPFPRPAYRITPLPFSTVSVSFSPRKVGLVYTPPTPSRNGSSLSVNGHATPYGSKKRTLVEVTRTKEESLEVTAKQLVKALKAWLQEDAGW